MPRILITNKYFAPDIGGVETVVEQYASWLSETETAETTVLCCSKTFNWRTRVERYKGLKVIRCSSFGSLMGMPISLSYFWHFWRLAWRSDVINIHYPFPLADLAMAVSPKRGKLIYTIHANILGKGRLGSFVRWLGRAGLRRADLLAPTSAPLSDRFFPDLDLPREVVPLAVPPTANLPGKRPEFQLPERYMIFLGRLSRYKGHDVLLEAARLRAHTDIPILIVGHGQMAPDLTAALKAIDAPQNVRFIETVTSESEKRYLLEKADALLFPSTTEAEAFGIVQLEAMAQGTPIINTALGTGVEWVSIDDISGLTIKAGCAVELASAMDRISQDDTLRERLSEGSRKRALLFSEPQARAQVLALLAPAEPTISPLPEPAE